MKHLQRDGPELRGGDVLQRPLEGANGSSSGADDDHRALGDAA